MPNVSREVMNPHRTNLRNLLVSANCKECIGLLHEAMLDGNEDRIRWITEFICDYWEDWKT